MYCQKCDADVAAGVSADGKSLQCTACGTPFAAPPNAAAGAQSARDLLERWSAEDDFAETPAAPLEPAPPQPAQPPSARVVRADAGGSIPAPKMRTARRPGSRPQGREEGQGGVATQDRPPAPQRRPELQPPAKQQPNAPQEIPPEVARKIAELQRIDAQKAVDSAIADVGLDTEPPGGTTSGGKTYRVDAAHPRPAGDGPPVPPPHKRAAPEMPDGHRLDAAHAVAGPHFDTAAFVPEVDNRTGRAESLTGQVLAYLGVGLLTVGTAVLLWGYFGGPVAYTPTGWLVATVGQMVLFLGVVTLISGGMQQTTHQVSTHVAYLNDRLGRIESTTDAFLNGPHFRSSRGGGTKAGVANRDSESA